MKNKTIAKKAELKAIKFSIKEDIKTVLVQMAINGELDGDINSLNTEKFNKALKILDDKIK